ncbi:MAG: hypothetical protein UV20_C0024G0008 [Candidatus Magasanikbacteria bacterium GW2011_GWA2_42_32]|uniref:Uncharacterized protein n=1 Tax=Candidatus Magasanikbacteria bacterium GW2011_GWA2_42_32 TaxID=1619039 RepID=A0A0G1A3M0_9BACT|nr:MAG: hypothetical protein UV20_C0024G0008 [Candidatus Magasanikbacteria bacterium GW2011_GWA2_42_32]
MKLGWQSIIGPIFWIGATYLAITYGPGWVNKLRGKSAIENSGGQIRQNLNKSILGRESENATGEDNKSTLGKIIPDKLPASPQEVPQYIKEIIERTMTTVVERGQTEVEEKKTEVVKSTCGQIIAEIEKQCNITTSN